VWYGIYCTVGAFEPPMHQATNGGDRYITPAELVYYRDVVIKT
jgi:hypothetical protein